MTNQEIQAYWDKRALEDQDRTTKDKGLRRLEFKAIKSKITRTRFQLLDIGCGDGWLTAALAEHFDEAHIIGIDASPNMIEVAQRTAGQYIPNLEFRVQDVLTLVPDNQYDYIVTNRAIINLSTEEDQRKAFQTIKSLLKPGGIYIGTENFLQSHIRLNRYRVSNMVLPAIPIREHNKLLTWELVMSSLPGCKVEYFADSYYLATRLFYSALCVARGSGPDYDSLEHEVAELLPSLDLDLCPTKLIVYHNPNV